MSLCAGRCLPDDAVLARRAGDRRVDPLFLVAGAICALLATVHRLGALLAKECPLEEIVEPLHALADVAGRVATVAKRPQLDADLQRQVVEVLRDDLLRLRVRELGKDRLGVLPRVLTPRVEAEAVTGLDVLLVGMERVVLVDHTQDVRHLLSSWVLKSKGIIHTIL